MAKVNMGGQAVLEGVMILGGNRVSMAVRRKDASITVHEETLTPFGDRHPWAKWPVIRGVVNLVSQLKLGYRMLMLSAQMMEEDETGEEAQATSGLSMWLTTAVAVVFAIALFFLLPSVVAGWFVPVGSRWLTLAEGAVRILIFMGYMIAVSAMSDMRRVYMYHGAEHKVLHCYENDVEPTPENAQKFSRLHPKCGTSYLFLVMMVSILVFSLLGRSDVLWMRLLLRIALLPLVAGLSYEVLRWAAKYDGIFSRIIRAPGLLLQRLSTREPDDEMIEVAAVAYKSCAEGSQTIQPEDVTAYASEAD